jgi:hypothetical protein
VIGKDRICICQLQIIFDAIIELVSVAQPCLFNPHRKDVVAAEAKNQLFCFEALAGDLIFQNIKYDQT